MGCRIIGQARGGPLQAPDFDMTASGSGRFPAERLENATPRPRATVKRQRPKAKEKVAAPVGKCRCIERRGPSGSA